MYKLKVPTIWMTNIGMPTAYSNDGMRIIPGSDPMPCGKIDPDHTPDPTQVKCLHSRRINDAIWLLLQSGQGESVRFALAPKEATEFVV